MPSLGCHRGAPDDRPWHISPIRCGAWFDRSRRLSGPVADIAESTQLTPSGHLHRHPMLRPRRANASCRTPEREQTDKLADRRRVEDAAGVPQLIETARDAELRASADIALINFAVVAHVANDAHSPILGQVEFLAIVPVGADEPHHVRLLGLERLIDVL